MQKQARQNLGNPERRWVCLRAIGDVASVQTSSGRHIPIGPDRTVEMSAEDAQCLIRAGWTKLGEWIEDEPAEYEHIKEPNTPEGPQITYAVGSMEWHAQVEKEPADRKAALEEEEKRRLARLAAFLDKKS